MIVKTKYVTNHNGRSQVIAKCQGKQRTVSYDDAVSSDANHGSAAAAVMVAVADGNQHILRLIFDALGNHSLRHTMSDDGCQHTFSL